jgi:carbamoyl-phosphate synthase large subunit
MRRLMTRILLTGAGGAPSTNFVRSLRLAVGHHYEVIGVDADPWCLQRAETDQRHLIVPCSHPAYLALLNQLVEETGAELIYAQPDVEIATLSERREELAAPVFLPAKETVRICQDKYASFARWKAAGLRVPETMMIATEDDLRTALATLGPRIWIRAVQGAWGKGSLPTEDFAQAKAWLDFQRGWGTFSAAECLEPQSITWQSIWQDGELIVAQGRKRLYWEFANRAPSGVTGITGAGVTMSDPVLDEIAERAIRAIDARPHGIFSVDLTYDRHGMPNPTEINIGRFFTTHLFFSAAGLNMPHLYVQLALGRPIEAPARRVNPLPDGLVWVRGMDVEPVLTDEPAIAATRDDLARRLARARP